MSREASSEFANRGIPALSFSPRIVVTLGGGTRRRERSPRLSLEAGCCSKETERETVGASLRDLSLSLSLSALSPLFR